VFKHARVSTPDLPKAVGFALDVVASMNLAIARIPGIRISYCNRGVAKTRVLFWILDPGELMRARPSTVQQTSHAIMAAHCSSLPAPYRYELYG
jgi:hypothetical protein